MDCLKSKEIEAARSNGKLKIFSFDDGKPDAL